MKKHFDEQNQDVVSRKQHPSPQRRTLETSPELGGNGGGGGGGPPETPPPQRPRGQRGSCRAGPHGTALSCREGNASFSLLLFSKSFNQQALK